MPDSVRRSVTRSSYARRPAHQDRAPPRVWHVTQLLVQRSHRDVSLLALGDEPFEAGLLRGGDLCALHRGRDAAAAMRAQDGGQAVVRLGAEVVQRAVADGLAVFEGDEQEVVTDGRPVDGDGAPPLERQRAIAPRNVLVTLDADRVEGIRKLRPVGK